MGGAGETQVTTDSPIVLARLWCGFGTVEDALPPPRLLRVAGAAAVAVVGLSIALHPWANDAHGIVYSWDDGLYDVPWLDNGAYVYAPPIAQLLWPLSRLPWEVVWPLWVAAQTAALLWMVGPVWAAVLLILPWLPFAGYLNPVHGTLVNGNPQLLLTAAILVGFRWRAAWALPVLMKVTPAIGLIWFAVRREWAALAVAASATAAVTLVSFVAVPELWWQWARLIGQASGADARAVELVYLPLLVRLPIAMGFVAWGAHTSRAWTLPLGVMLALPAISYGGLSVAVGALMSQRGDS